LGHFLVVYVIEISYHFLVTTFRHFWWSFLIVLRGKDVAELFLGVSKGRVTFLHHFLTRFGWFGSRFARKRRGGAVFGGVIFGHFSRHHFSSLFVVFGGHFWVVLRGKDVAELFWGGVERSGTFFAPLFDSFWVVLGGVLRGKDVAEVILGGVIFGHFSRHHFLSFWGSFFGVIFGPLCNDLRSKSLRPEMRYSVQRSGTFFIGNTNAQSATLQN
jgi:hypothetical protein